MEANGTAVAKTRRNIPVIAVVSQNFIYLARTMEALDILFLDEKIHSSWRWNLFEEHAAYIHHDIVIYLSEWNNTELEIRTAIERIALRCPEAKIIHYAMREHVIVSSEVGCVVYPAHKELAGLIAETLKALA